ncbi:hypothetical protein AAFF_G00319930 [Aldrovandia affinis]|uniref:Trichohyalin-plectin-homology domain-containing protein n=1 Tax=Aldrovandia affinis TaxID=143900 RepID=A0AAD7SN72_9TELE|nr:hypothetical protein AAFF_G00319930 [Aldrovandia affinis]
MEMESVSVERNGRSKGLQRQREEALAKAICQQFYQSDRVKQFHRALLHTEALKERDDQMNQKWRMINAAKEETRKCMADVRCKELEAVEQQREKLRQQNIQKKAYGDFVKEQMKEQKLRNQRKAEKEKDVEECRQLCEQNEREKIILKQQQNEKKMNARKAHMEHLSATSTIRALESQKQEMKEERRRLFDMERETLMMRKNEKMIERRRVVQRYKEVVVGRLATEMQEKASKEEKLNAKIVAESTAKCEAKLDCERNENNEKNMAMLTAITKHREYKHTEQEMMAKGEEQSARDILNAGIEDDRFHWEMQQLKAEEKEEKRSYMDNILRHQMAERRVKSSLLQKERMDYDNKYAELIGEEEDQFQHYTTGVISAAKEANRNTLPLLRAANKGMWCGVGPITGGMRTDYLAPSANYDKIPNYVSTTVKDLKKLYGAANDQPAARRLDFIW